MKFLNQIDGAKDLVQDSNNRLVTDAEKTAWNSKSDTDTVTTVNGKTGAISKADIVALGIPTQDTVYTHPASHPASMITGLPTGKKVARFVVGTSTAGWTAADCDYLCNGTDDQTEINAAIIALPATGGEVVILDGTYNITAKIDVTKDNVSIRGNGNATILKRMFSASAQEGVITLTSRSGCKIANLQIDGNKTNYTNNYVSGIYLDSSSNNTVTGNISNNNAVSGLYSYNSSSNAVTGNTCNNNNYDGISLRYSSSNAVTGNTCNNNNYDGIFLEDSSNNNTVTGNTCIRGTGLATDYTESQTPIRLYGTINSYNLISNNNCMGKAPFVGGGTGNSVYGNKYDSGDYKDFTQDEKTKLAGIAVSANNYAHPTTAGNKHIPTGGASGQILRYSASGTAIWGADNDTITTINGKTGTIAKADIVALGVPAQDTVYTHPSGDGNLHVPATSTTNNGKVLKAGATAGSLVWATDNDTITTINGKTGAIAKADITALGIPAQDTVYTHPANHPASVITQDTSNRFVTDAEKTAWNAKGTSNLALGTTSSTAYRGDYGNTAYTHSQSAHAPSGAQVNQTLTSGNGMAAWTATNGNLTIPLGTPSTLTTATTNAVTTTSHTHSVTFPVTSVAGKTGAVTLGPTDVGAAAATHAHGTYDRATSALTGANVFSDIVVVDGIVSGTTTRALTAANVGAAASNHTHDYVPTTRTVNSKALSANIALTAADVGAAASSHTHSYLPLSGGTVTGGITKTTTPGNFIAGKTATNVLYFGATTQSYHPMIRVNSPDGHVWNLGGYENFVGFYGYFSYSTDDWAAWYTHWDTSSGALIHSGGLQVGDSIFTNGAVYATNIYEANTPLSMKYAAYNHAHSYVPLTRTINGKVLNGNISLTAADIGLGNVDNIKHMPISGGVLENYREKLTTVSAAGGSINLSLGNVFVHTPSGNRTYSITNAVDLQAHSFTLIVNMGSTVRTLTFPSSVKWQGGEIPDLTTASKTYVLTFMSVDGGTNWLGMFGGEF